MPQGVKSQRTGFLGIEPKSRFKKDNWRLYTISPITVLSITDLSTIWENH